MNLQSNAIYKELIKYKIVKKQHIKVLSNSIRDKNNVKALICEKSKVIFLSKVIDDKKYYKSFHKSYETYATPLEPLKGKVNLKSKQIIKTPGLNDHKRRYLSLKSFFYKKSVLDFGCSWGLFLNLLEKKKFAKNISGVELREECLQYMKNRNKNIEVKNNINKFKKKFDVVTLFHVLEHLTDQVEILKTVKKKIKKKGKIIVEVPSAQDFLISIDELPEFKKFTFWSEHLILHTEKSLRKYLTLAGFKKIKIKYVQRYGFANHLGWFLKKKPGGHAFFKKYGSKKIDLSYIQNLVKDKQTDTLVGIGER